MHLLLDSVEISSDDEETAVTMTKRLCQQR
jgi:hypothetical protein